LVRLWFALSFHKIRLLHGEKLEPSGPAILVVSHPASFLDALILVAALDQPVHCLLQEKLCRGIFRSLFVRLLGMILYDPGKGGGQAIVDAGCSWLAKGEAVLTFVDEHAPTSAQPARLTSTAAWIAAEAESRHSGHLRLNLFPIHLFLPLERSQAGELLVHVDSPVDTQDLLSHTDGGLRDKVRALVEAVDLRVRENSFRLQPEELNEFLADLEDVFRSDLEEDWAARSDWKQKADDFRLSGFVADWGEQLNYLNPGRLVALRESLDALREAQRRWSLWQFQIEAAGDWLKSPLRRAAVLLEAVLGLPVALYGLLNHLPALLILYAARLLKKESQRDQTVEWVSRAIVVLGCYAVQILLVSHRFGRATAGYYAPTLPATGAYLWRYRWLLRHRFQSAFWAMMLPRHAAKIRRLRKAFVSEMNQALGSHAELMGVPH
jgi:1-acyl-sn-glycerol-3-phosphate acyltransferase